MWILLLYSLNNIKIHRWFMSCWSLFVLRRDLVIYKISSIKNYKKYEIRFHCVYVFRDDQYNIQSGHIYKHKTTF